MFNTAFIQRGNYIKAGKMELSPEDIRKDNNKIVPEDFIVYIHLEDFCNVCDPYETEIEDLCNECKQVIGEFTLNEWREVKQIFDNHDFPSEELGHRMLPNVDPALLQSTLTQELQFNPNYYRIYTPREIDEAERQYETEMNLSQNLKRRSTQKFVSFPAQPDEINREGLSPLNPYGTEDSDREESKGTARQ